MNGQMFKTAKYPSGKVSDEDTFVSELQIQKGHFSRALNSSPVRKKYSLKKKLTFPQNNHLMRFFKRQPQLAIFIHIPSGAVPTLQ